jgi:membrane-associated protease RseP (regulator of RpoE activity)
VENLVFAGIMRDQANSIDTLNPVEAPPAPRPPGFVGVFGALSLIAVAILLVKSPAARLRLGILMPAFTILLATHLIPFYVFARLGKVTVQEFSLFFGGALLRWRRGETWFAVNWFPLGGYVKFKGMDNAPTAQGLEGTWQRLPPVLRAAICLSGPISVLLLSLIALGTDLFRDNLLGSPIQVRQLVENPAATIRSFLHFVDSAPFLVILGACGVKLSLMNLLPLPIMNGGQALVELTGLNRHRRLMEYFQLASLAIILASLIFIVYNAFVVLAH